MSIIKLYNAASDVVEKALKKEASIKSLCFSSRFQNKKLLFALVTETLKHHKIMSTVLKDYPDLWKDIDKKPSSSLQLILVYETLLGKGVPSKHQYGKVLQNNLASLNDIWLKKKEEHPKLLSCAFKKNVLPRYVRVNILKVSSEKVIERLKLDGKILVNNKKYKDLSVNEFCVDKDIPDLLVFESRTDFHKNLMYINGEILLQDKASCLPAFILNPPMGSMIIDACAAPGNKSSHLASITYNKSQIFSFDLDFNRLKLMQKLLKKSACTSVKTKHQDFLKVQHCHPLYSKVEYILLDPSCSGSGIVSRMDEFLDDEDSTFTNDSRLKALSGFQTAALSHALQFPNVKKVVYSTCSVHKEENEDVVEKAYNRFKETFHLCHAFPEWSNRGIGEWEQAYKCVRAVPTIDYTNGFFVALFERSNHHDVNLVNEFKNPQTGDELDETKDFLSKEIKFNGGMKSEVKKKKLKRKNLSDIRGEPFVCKKKKKKRSTSIKHPIAYPTCAKYPIKVP
ncbi:28S rRNA (cytosine-C(5))-methyltransferase isoform X2 [Hydra vulgaris]|uniref:28S rRNA (Cytosine-C(5))-methyltransferase isoform X2 n=1 Tax=Hydra vulgaris TaxID=6087 RepID=A0ABM4C5L1_HYDVU